MGTLKITLIVSFVLSLSLTTLGQPEGRYLISDIDGRFRGGYLDFRDGKVEYKDFKRMQTFEGRLKVGPPHVLSINEKQIRIYELGKEKLLLEPEGSRVRLAERVGEVPIWFRGEWASSEGRTLQLSEYQATISEEPQTALFKATWTQPVLKLDRLTGPDKGVLYLYLVHTNQLLTWNDSGEKRVFERQGPPALDFSTPEKLWQNLQESVRTQNPELFILCFHPDEIDYKNTKREVFQPGRFRKFCESSTGDEILSKKLAGVTDKADSIPRAVIEVEVEKEGAPAMSSDSVTDKANRRVTLIFEDRAEKDGETAIFRDGRWYLEGL